MTKILTGNPPRDMGKFITGENNEIFLVRRCWLELWGYGTTFLAAQRMCSALNGSSYAQGSVEQES